MRRIIVAFTLAAALLVGAAPAGAFSPSQRGLACTGVTHHQLELAYEAGTKPMPPSVRPGDWAELLRLLHDPAVHAAIGDAVAKGGPAVACVGSPPKVAGIAGYRLLRATSLRDITEVFRTSDLSRQWYLDTGVRSGAHYYYRADVLDAAGNVLVSSRVVAVKVPTA